jgi:Tol biopolymer transport system component
MKTTLLLLLCAIAVSLLTAITVTAQTREDAPMVLEQAAHAEMVEGDLARAATLYRQVAMSASASRNHVAQALVALGNTYELQGSPEAITAYGRVVSEFSDQPGLFLAARAKLNAISVKASSGEGGKSAGAEYELVLQEMHPSRPPNPRIYDFSPDGAKLITAAPATSERKQRFPNLLTELYVRDTSGSVSRPLIEDAKDWEWIGHPRWSPNGQYVFYAQGKSGVERRLMLLNLRTKLTKQLPGEYLQIADDFKGAEWMPDSAGLVIQSRDGFRIIGLNGKLKKHFAGELDHMTRMGDVSPGGRHLLYHKVTANKEDHGEMDIWQLDLESGEHTEVTNDPGFEGWPVWSRDGKHIYYVSGPKVARNVFRRTPGSDESPEKITAYNNASVIYPQILPEGGQLTFTLMKDNHVILTADTSAMDSPRSVVRGSKAMLSPDGKSIYYMDDQPGRVGMWRVSVKGDNPLQLVSGTVLTSYGPRTLLSPDGSKIAYAQHTGETTSLFVMPSSGGAATELYSTRGIRHLIPAWSPSGKEIAFSIDGDMLVIPRDGGDTKVLASAKGWESWSLEWSPNGKSIAAFAFLEDEEGNVILVVDRATKKVTRVTPKSEDAYKEILAWHPNGDRISYMYYNPEDSNGSRIASLETSQISDLVDMPDPMWDYIGYWGPDKRYYFISAVRGYGNGWGLYAYDEKSRKYQKIRQFPVKSVSLPTWSADGKLMAWSEKEPVRQLWMMSNYE